VLNPEDEGTAFRRNLCNCLLVGRPQLGGRLKATEKLPWKFQILQKHTALHRPGNFHFMFQLVRRRTLDKNYSVSA